MNKSDALNFVESIDGFLTKDETEALFDFAAASTIGVVEIGAYHGKSTIALACGAKVKVWSIDPLDRFVDFPLSVSGYDKVNYLSNLLVADSRFNILQNINIINEKSENAAYLFDGVSYDLLFIDGNHSRAFEDFKMFYPCLAKGGVIMFHDTDRDDVSDGIKKALSDKHFNLEFLRNVDTMGIYKK